MSQSLTERRDAALRFVAEGRHAEAEWLVDDILSAVPHDVDAWAIKGSLHLAKGQAEPAFEIFGRLAQAAPERADVLANLGLVHRLENRGEDARLCYEQAITLAPDIGTYRCALVGILLSLGEMDAAKAEMRVLADLPSALSDPALQGEIFGLDARIALLENRPAAAERAIRRALEARPGTDGDFVLLSDALAQLGRREEALRAAESAYLLAPASPDLSCLLARRMMEAGRMASAEQQLKRLAAVAPFHPEATFLLSRLQLEKGDADGGIARFAGLVRRAPQDPALLMRMATLLRLAGRLEQSLVCASQAARGAPGEAAYAFWQDELKLALGRVEEVWPIKAEPQIASAILVPATLPAGDALLLARFARRAGADGGPPVCHIDAELAPLLASVPGLNLSLAPPPADAVPLSEVPKHVGVDLSDFSAAPYVTVDPARCAQWVEALAEYPGMKVGLMWGPELGLGALVESVTAALGGDATLVSLAFDARRQDLEGAPSVLDAGLHISDAGDLAALIAQMDLVITPDGLAAHLAGALGRAGVVAVPPARPWTWAQREGRALWYPSLAVAVLGAGASGLNDLTEQVRAMVRAFEMPGGGEA